MREVKKSTTSLRQKTKTKAQKLIHQSGCWPDAQHREMAGIKESDVKQLTVGHVFADHNSIEIKSNRFLLIQCV